MLDQLWVVVELLMACTIGVIILLQLIQLWSMNGRKVALDNAKITVSGGRLWFPAMIQVIFAVAIYEIFGSLAASMAIIAYCIEWAKVTYVLQQRRKLLNGT